MGEGTVNDDRLREALDLLTDGPLLNRIDRHNADAFVDAVAVVCSAARKWKETTDGNCLDCGEPLSRHPMPTRLYRSEPSLCEAARREQ